MTDFATTSQVDTVDTSFHQWHARLLFISDGAGKWNGATPELSIQVVDLTVHRVILLERSRSTASTL